MANLAGTVIPLPTPFDEIEEVDEKTFREIIDFELGAKVDVLMVAGSEAGVRCTIAPMASVFPELCVELWSAAAKKDRENALSLQERVKKLYAVVADYAKRVGRTAYKELHRLRGIQMKMYPRWPAKQLDEKERAELRARLAEAGWPLVG